MARDVEPVERYQNLRHFFERPFKLNDVLEVPFPFTIFERPKGVIVFRNSVISGLDVHWVCRFLVSANGRPNGLQAFRIWRENQSLLKTLHLLNWNPIEEEICGYGKVPTG